MLLSPENTLWRRARVRTFIVLGCLVLAVLALLPIFSPGGGDMGPLFVGIAVTLVVVALPFALDIRWSRRRAREVDALLAGEERLGRWAYEVNEEGEPAEGYVYVGKQGVYKDGDYFYFEQKERHLVEASFAEGEPATLTFVCREVRTLDYDNRASQKIETYPQLVAPVPAGQEAAARQIAARLEAEIAAGPAS